jgi:hypothetical protein
MTTIKVPYRISEIDVNNICYTDIKVNSKKTIIYMKYSDNNKLKNIVFQTPTFISTNLVQCKNNIYELDVPLIGKETNKIDKFINFLNALDKKIIKDARNNNKWFENFADVKTMKYQRIIRDATDKNNTNGVIRLKLLKTNDFETIIHNNNSKINIEEINKDSWLKCILEVYAIWINPNGFGLFIRPILLSLKPCTRINYNYKLIEDSDEADEDVNIDTIQDNSIFIRSENDITSSVLEMPKNTPSSEEPVQINDFEDALNSTTSSEH